MKPLLPFLLVLFSVPLSAHAGGGVTINWSNELKVNNYQSDGSPLLTGFTFLLGSFGTTFQPTESNTEDWLANWKPFDQAAYNAPVGYYASTGILQDNAVFASGEQAYLWVYNTTDSASDREWLLLTDDSTDGITADDWTFPTAPGTQTTLPENWVVQNSPAGSYHVIFGGAEDTQGGGSYTDPPAGYQLQTHSLAAVPEPSAAILAIGAAGFALLRRRRA